MTRLHNAVLLVAALLFAVGCSCSEDDNDARDRTSDAGSAGGGNAAGQAGSGLGPDVGPGGSAGTGAAGGAGGAAGDNAGGTAGEGPPPVSLYCGDGVRDPVLEECDDGLDEAADLCTADCRVSDALSVQEPSTAVFPARRLGPSRHAVAAGKAGFAVALLDKAQSTPAIRLSTFDKQGVFVSSADLTGDGQGSIVEAAAVASVTDGFVAVWTDHGGDGDRRGVAMRKVGLDGAPVGPIRFANARSAFSQYEPDILSFGNQLVVAWTDDTSASTGPDISYRVFDSSLEPASAQLALGAAPAGEARVSLARYGTTWAAAWFSAAENGQVLLRVSAPSSGADWTIGPYFAGSPDDYAGLAELSDRSLLVVYTALVDGVSRLYGAVLTAGSASVEPFAIEPSSPEYLDPSGAQNEPVLASVGQHLYVGWRSAQFEGGEGEDLWLRPIARQSTASGIALNMATEFRVPRLASSNAGDQKGFALAAARVGWVDALAIAWEDWGLAAGATDTPRPDIVVQFAPLPLLRFAETNAE